MWETPEELEELQRLLDSSLSDASAHLRTIMSHRTITAERLCGVLSGMCTLCVSTVTAQAEPRISAVDGHFLRGRWYFGTAREAVKARHLQHRPAVSVAHVRGEDLGVFTHGQVEALNPAGGRAAADWPEILRYFQEFYGMDAFDWDNEVVWYRVCPQWMVAYAPDEAKLDTGQS